MKTRLKRKEPKKEGLRRVRSELLGIYNSCLENAEELIEEAELLFTHGHFPRAYALGFTAYEELGKSQIVADLFTDKSLNLNLKRLLMTIKLRLLIVKDTYWFPKTLKVNGILNMTKVQWLIV